MIRDTVTYEAKTQKTNRDQGGNVTDEKTPIYEALSRCHGSTRGKAEGDIQDDPPINLQTTTNHMKTDKTMRTETNEPATKTVLKPYYQMSLRKQRAWWSRTLRRNKTTRHDFVRDVWLVLQLGLTCDNKACTAPAHTNICHIPGFVVCAVGASYEDTVKLVKQTSDDELLPLVYSC